MSQIDEEVKKLNVTENVTQVECGRKAQVTTLDDSIFTVSVGGVSASSCSTAAVSQDGVGHPGGSAASDAFLPCPRRRASIALKQGQLFLYGGVVEDDENERDLTLSDFYAIDVHKLDRWRTLIQLDTAKMVGTGWLINHH